jgi:hypothetical protein
MNHTLAAAGHLLRRDRTPWENFQAVIQLLMDQGTPWLPAVHKSGLRWLGDKKPFQHTDPQLVPFILENFPDALFLHIVRHPCAVTASSDHFNQHDGDFWQGLSPEEKVRRWAFHEKRVVELNLCRRTERELSGVFRFLGLKPDAQVLRDAARQTVPASRPFPKINCPAEALQLAARHGYDLEKPAGRLRTVGTHWYWKLAKRFH